MDWQVMSRFDSYEQACRQFSWDLPEHYNPAVDFCRWQSDPSAEALRYVPEGGGSVSFTFADLDRLSDRLARAFETRGVERGDRIGVVVPQRPENPVTHLANWKLGAVSVPLTVLFGPEALQYRLADSSAKAVVVAPDRRETIEAVRDDCPALDTVIEIGGPGEVTADNLAFRDLPEIEDHSFEPAQTSPETTTAIMYTSGSTGPPKGVRHSHALWLGRAAAAFNYFEWGLPEATVWTPADWAWGAALGGTLFATWHYGGTVVGTPRTEFDPEATFELLERHGVTHTFMPPTALRMLMQLEDPTERYDLALETIAAAGEPLTPEVLEWVRTRFDNVTLNEFYGQTELNLVVGNCSKWFETRPGSMGRPLPGYAVTVLDPETREPLPTDEVGELAVRPGEERVFFDCYHNKPEATAAKRTDDGWYLTGDLVSRDEDGFCWFVARIDDVILTSGYRVGPMEIEEVILEHEVVEQVGVIGIPDKTRGEAIKAIVKPAAPVSDPDELRTEIKSLVRNRLAAHEYPREIEFVEQLPTTTTGKIRRQSLRERETEDP